ncbi:hypothetical protein EPN81_01265 [Patescibacteria group bacterium]|nr:MAG: hypothetical protein EPN81_01265 [Patescibacteria group bacterium]
MLESMYNMVLFVLAIVGALRAGSWVVGRGWQWYWKAAAMVVVAAAVLGFAQQIHNGSKTDLRIVTEVLASLGAIMALEFSFRHVRDNRWRAALVAMAGVFLFVTWTESIDRFMGTMKTVPSTVSPPVLTAAPTSVSRATPTPRKPTRKELCDQGRIDFQSCLEWGYK